MDNQEHCVCCGNPIPEGYMTCYKCRKNSMIHNPDVTIVLKSENPKQSIMKKINFKLIKGVFKK